MATSCEQVFAMAMQLSDNLDEATGDYNIEENDEYRNRTIGILNILRGDLYPYSDTYPTPEAGKRPIVDLLVNFEDLIGLDDFLCQSIMPWGLAAWLMLGEDNDKYNAYIRKYEELKAELATGRGMPASTGDFETEYFTIDENGMKHYYDWNPLNFLGRW